MSRVVLGQLFLKTFWGAGGGGVGATHICLITTPKKFTPPLPLNKILYETLGGIYSVNLLLPI